MRIRLGACIAAIAVASLTGASAASAATEFGDNCVGNEEAVAATFFEISAVAGNPLPPGAPSAGVITKLKINLIPTPITFPHTIKVLRLNTGTKTAQVVAETIVTVTGGLNSYDARIPVQAGDRLSLFGAGPEVKTVVCDETGVTSILGVFEGNGSGVGSSSPYVESPPIPAGVPVSAVLEPDADNDGFGDETQDKCPQAASTQAECPVIVLDSFPLAKKSSIVVLVAASESGSVSVSGSAKLPKASKASVSAKAKLKKVTKKVTAGKIARFTLKFPGNLKAALKSLPRGKKITVNLQATATNVAGQVSRDKAKLKLKR
jgi:hypothetical protein